MSSHGIQDHDSLPARRFHLKKSGFFRKKEVEGVLYLWSEGEVGSDSGGEVRVLLDGEVNPAALRAHVGVQPGLVRPNESFSRVHVTFECPEEAPPPGSQVLSPLDMDGC